MSFRPLVSVLVGLFLLAAILWESGRHASGPAQARRITDEIESASGVGDVEGLDVAVNGATRVAVVRGLVDTESERLAATEAALRVRGLLTVYNELRVDRLLEELLVRLDQLLDADPTDGEFDYRVDGHEVFLNGWVPEGEEDLRDEIEKLVRQVPGVREVHNNIGLGRPDEDIQRVRELILDILRLGNIYFDYNKATIRPESMPSLRKIAGVLAKYPDVALQVEGHTDSIASEAYNQRLSEARAASVQQALVEFGVAEERIQTVGHGETRPVAPNDTPEGRAENRRIEFSVLRGDLEPEDEDLGEDL